MDHTQAAERTRSLLRRSDEDQWEAARITHDMLASGQTSLRRWAGAVGISKTQVAHLRDVWARYGRVHRGGHPATWSFNEYLSLARVSSDAADEIERRASDEGRSPTTIHRERRRDPDRLLRERLDDGQLDRLFEDEEFRTRVERRLRQHGGRRRRDGGSDDPSTAPEQLSFDFDDLGRVERETYALLGRLIHEEIAKAERRDLLANATKLRNEYDWMIAVLTGGDADLIRRLERVIARGAPVGPVPTRRPTETKPPTHPPRKRVADPPPQPPVSEAPDPATLPPAEEAPAKPPRREREERRGPRRRDREPVGVA